MGPERVIQNPTTGQKLVVGLEIVTLLTVVYSLVIQANIGYFIAGAVTGTYGMVTLYSKWRAPDLAGMARS